MKQCTKCLVIKPQVEFYARRRGGYQTGCKECIKAERRAYTRAFPERRRLTDKKTSWKQTYGITPEDYKEMLESQGGGCALCGKKPPTGRHLSVDHCHYTGKVRGLLCVGCNVKLHALENVEFYEKALAYLETAPCRKQVPTSSNLQACGDENGDKVG